MNHRNCVRCGRLFTYVSKPICENCARKEEEDFLRIKEFIEENPGMNLNDIAKGTEVPVNRIMKYLREGRLELSKGSGNTIDCERCGKPIQSGRFCSSCISGFNSTVNEMYEKSLPELKKHISDSVSPKMYTYDRDKRR